MSRKMTRNLTVLCVSALTALSLLAVGAVTAQAAEWTVGGKQIKELTGGKETLTLSTGGLGSVSVGPFSIDCAISHSHTTVKEAGVNNGTIEFGSCEVRDSKGKSAAETCSVTKAFLLKVNGLLSKDAMYDIFSSSTGGAMATVTVENASGQKCLLIEKSPEVLEITGTLGALVSGNSLTFSEAIQTASEAKLKFGSSTAFVEGSLKQELIGVYEGQELGAIK